MEGFGVLRAAARAGVPAVEVRSISNAVAVRDRGQWRIEEALDALRIALLALVAEVSRAYA
jgi:futalosine hydrolase